MTFDETWVISRSKKNNYKLLLEINTTSYYPTEVQDTFTSSHQICCAIFFPCSPWHSQLPARSGITSRRPDSSGSNRPRPRRSRPNSPAARGVPAWTLIAPRTSSWTGRARSWLRRKTSSWVLWELARQRGCHWWRKVHPWTLVSTSIHIVNGTVNLFSLHKCAISSLKIGLSNSLWL